MRSGLAKILENVCISRLFERPETDLHIAEKACCKQYTETWMYEGVHGLSITQCTNPSTSAKCKMVWMSQLKNSATLNSHTDASRWVLMLPARLSAKRWAFWCSKATSQVLLNVLEMVEQNSKYPEECMVVCEMLQIQTIRMCKYRSYWEYWPRLQDYSSVSWTRHHTLQ